MFKEISKTVKDTLYESASTDFCFDDNGDEMLVIVYEREDVVRIANLFNVDFNALNNYWRDFLGLEG